MCFYELDIWPKCHNFSINNLIIVDDLHPSTIQNRNRTDSDVALAYLNKNSDTQMSESQLSKTPKSDLLQTSLSAQTPNTQFKSQTPRSKHTKTPLLKAEVNYEK
jgi:hypothetical protein